jgi:hypothetical protein
MLGNAEFLLDGFLKAGERNEQIDVTSTTLLCCTTVAGNYTAERVNVKTFSKTGLRCSIKVKKSRVDTQTSLCHVAFSLRDRSKNMESPSINMKFRRRNFVVNERGVPSSEIIGLIKSFSFACKSEATRIVAFPQ